MDRKIEQALKDMKRKGYPLTGSIIAVCVFKSHIIYDKRMRGGERRELLPNVRTVKKETTNDNPSFLLYIML